MSDVVMNMILAVAVLAIIVSLWRAHRANGSSRYNKFNLIDLVTTNDGYIDRPAFQETIVFIVMTWAVVTYTIKEELTEWLAGIYIATFVIRAAHSAYLNSKENTPLPPVGVTTTFTASSVKTEEQKP